LNALQRERNEFGDIRTVLTLFGEMPQNVTEKRGKKLFKNQSIMLKKIILGYIDCRPNFDGITH